MKCGWFYFRTLFWTEIKIVRNFFASNDLCWNYAHPTRFPSQPHSRRPRGSQSGQENQKGNESFQERVKTFVAFLILLPRLTLGLGGCPQPQLAPV